VYADTAYSIHNDNNNITIDCKKIVLRDARPSKESLRSL